MCTEVALLIAPFALVIFYVLVDIISDSIYIETNSFIHIEHDGLGLVFKSFRFRLICNNTCNEKVMRNKRGSKIEKIPGCTFLKQNFITSLPRGYLNCIFFSF